MLASIRSAARSGFLVLATMTLAGTALAVPRVTSYDPSNVECGAELRIRGDDLPRADENHTVRYGQATTPLGRVASVAVWGRIRTRVTLPDFMPPGRYWLAHYGPEGRLESNQLRTLNVTCGDAPDMTPGGMRAAPPPVLLKPQSDSDIARRRITGSGALGAGMAREVARRAETNVDFGLRLLEQPEARIGRSFYPILQVHRRGLAGREARLHLKGKADGQPRWGGIRVTVRANSHSREQPAGIVVTPDLIRGGQMQVTYKLVNTDGTAWRDADPSNDQITLNVPVAGPVTYRVSATLSDIRIKGDCDNRSWGEWYFSVGLRDQNAEGRWRNEYFPTSQTIDLDDGARVSGTPTVSISGVPFDHVLGVNAVGTDCDRGNAHGPRCAGQEDQLLTGLPVGAHTMDVLGTTKDLQPSEWTRGSGATVPIDLGNSSCGWTAHVSLQARQE